MRRSTAVVVVVGLVLSSGPAFAQHGVAQRDHAAHMAMASPSQPSQAAGSEGSKAEAEVERPREFTTTQSIDVGGRSLRYRTVAGEIHLDGEDGEPAASIFSTAYFKVDLVNEPETRPITFVFNGGPGSSSVWLHLSALGPKIVDLGPDPLEIGAPPYPLRPNPNTLLTHTDLVFVDPVGTGFSRAIGGRQDSDFWGVDEDTASMARFIRAFLTKHGRWRSPRYLAGESYGTVRATLLLRDLSLETLNGVAFNGVILISPAMDARLFLNGAPGNELPWVTHLPTYAATAYYHDRLPEGPEDLDAFLDEVREFASTWYLAALFRGDSLSETETREIASELHRFTGLSEEYLLRSDLRVNPRRFLKELLRDEGTTLGVHDTRFQGSDPDDAGEAVVWDPFLEGIAAPFVSAAHSYFAEELGVALDEDYVVFSTQANYRWKRPAGLQSAFSGFLNTMPYLAEAAAANRDLRIFAASGLYDLTTSFFGVEYLFDQSGIDSDRLTIRSYEGGHMMYLRRETLERMADDLRGFFDHGP